MPPGNKSLYSWFVKFLWGLPDPHLHLIDTIIIITTTPTTTTIITIPKLSSTCSISNWTKESEIWWDSSYYVHCLFYLLLLSFSIPRFLRNFHLSFTDEDLPNPLNISVSLFQLSLVKGLDNHDVNKLCMTAHSFLILHLPGQALILCLFHAVSKLILAASVRVSSVSKGLSDFQSDSYLSFPYIPFLMLWNLHYNTCALNNYYLLLCHLICFQPSGLTDVLSLCMYMHVK
jgi:hypothetical protein